MSLITPAWERILSVREKMSATSAAARRSVLWMLLARNRRDVRASVVLFFVQIVFQLLITNATVAMVDNAIVDQAVPLGPYVTHIARLAVVALVVGFAARQLMSRLSYQIEFDLRTWLYTRVQYADLQKLDKISSGQLVTRAMTDLRMVQQILQFLPTIVTLVPITLALLLYLMWLSFPLAILASLALPLNLWLLTKFRTRLWGLSWAELNERAEVAGAVDEPVRGIRVVRSFGREQHERWRLREAAVRTYRYSMTRIRLLARYDIALKIIPLTVNALVLVVGARLVAGDVLSIGVFLVAFQVAGGVTRIAQIFDEVASGWQYLRGAQHRLAEVLAMGRRPREGRAAADEFAGIDLRDVQVAFGDTTVIEGLSFSAGPGQLVSVGGPPGSGKTTVASVICGLVQPTGGEVLLDGEPLSDHDITTIRTMVRLVAEEPVLFSGTLRENLDLGAAWVVSDEEMDAALYAAGADDIVREMPDGLDTAVGDRGLTLSGGQRQRLALARALLAKPRVIVLDDALSAVNPSHELDILRRIRGFLPESAIVCISRRPGATAIADEVIHLPGRSIGHGAEVVAQPFSAPDADVESDLMRVVTSLEVSSEMPIIDDAKCEIDEMPRMATLVRYTALTVVGVLGLLALNSVTELGPQILFSEATNAADDADTSASDLIGLGVVLAGVGFAFSAYFLRILAMKIAQSVVYLLRRRIFLRLTRLGIDYYDRELPGEVAARVVNDLDTILTFASERAYRFISNGAKFLTGITIVLIIAPETAAVVLGLAGVILTLTLVQLVAGLRAFNRARDDLGLTVATFEEHFFGRAELRGCGAQHKANDRFVARVWELRQSRRWATSLGNSYAELVQFSIHVGGALILASAGDAVLAGSLAVGAALSARLITEQALQPLPFMAPIYMQLLDAKVSWDRLHQPFDAPIRPEERPGAVEASSLTGDIIFDNVSFTYPNTTRQVLHDVSFSIPAGSVATLVGFTGAGKSSITKLLLRTYEPTPGRVLVGGTDIRSFDSASYRRRLGVVPQEAFLFKGTIRSNVAYARPDAGIEEIEEAARAVGAHEVLVGLANGYDHEVEEEGRNLTAAQRQLIALARAWLSRPDVLILDEATSSLDTHLEARVLDAIAKLGVTTLAVTHRDNVAERADLTIVLEGGRVVEIGHPHELIGGGSAYDRLWTTEEMLTGAGGAIATRTRTRTRSRRLPRTRVTRAERPLRARRGPSGNGSSPNGS